MANLGTIGFSQTKQQNGAYFHPVTGLGKITGTAQQGGINVTAKIMLIDEATNTLVDIAVGSSFNFKGLSLTRKFTVLAQDLASTNYNALVYDRLTAVSLP